VPNPTAARARLPRSSAPTVLLLGERRAARAPAAVLQANSIATVACSSLSDALAREWGNDPPVALLCLVQLTRRVAATIESLRDAFAETAVIVLSPNVERWELRCALAAGACGVLEDDGNLARSLPPCVSAVLAGQVCVPAQHRRQIEPPALSAREKQVLGLVVMGYMNSQIAEQLFLAECTVKSHLSSAFGKLGVRSRNEAARMILDPDRGLGMGILGLSGERRDTSIASL
jgi:DNA-binding NarL/FixJ family response regulator